MARPNRFKRKIATRPYKKVFYLFTEGYKTEPLYFQMLNKNYSYVHIKIKSHQTKSDLLHILERAKKFFKEEKPQMENSEIWLVADIDDRDKKQFDLLQKWVNEKNNCYLAISNPKFEYWLLLHFEKGNNVKSSKDCSTRLKQHMPNFEKRCLDEEKLLKNIVMAISNAKEKYRQCDENFFAGNCSTVYFLVEKIIEDDNTQF